MFYDTKPQSVLMLFLFAFSIIFSNSILAQEIEVDPQELNFGECIIGAVNEMNFTIRNIGDAPLRIDSLIRSDHFEVWIKEFADARRTLLNIYNAALQYRWEKSTDPASVTELIEKNYIVLEESIAEQWSFTLIGSNPIAEMEAVSSVEMPYGAGYVVLWDVLDDILAGQTKPDDLSISSNEVSNCTVIFNPQETDSYEETITIESNDPDNGSVSLNVAGTGIHEEVIEVDLWSSNFGMVKRGEAKVAPITIKNSGNRNVMIDEIEFDDDTFCLLYNEAVQARLAIIDIIKAIEMYNLDYESDPGTVEELIELHYLVLDEDVAWNWYFSLIGINPIVQIEAVSTSLMQRGRGHIIIWDAYTGGFFGYGGFYGSELGVGNEWDVSLFFMPYEIREYNCTMTIISDDPINPEIEIELQGNGVMDVQTETEPTPTEYGLFSAYPNPFNSTTTITYQLGKPAPTRLALYDLSGREVRMVFEGYRQAGFHSVNLNADDLSSGLYYIRLETAGQVFTRKILLVR